MHTEPTTFSADSYFATQLPPPTLQQDVEQVREFVQKQIGQGRNVVLVTVRPASWRSQNLLTLSNIRVVVRPCLWSSMCEPSPVTFQIPELILLLI